MGRLEEREAMVAGFNLALAYLRGYVASRADANRRHLTQNLGAIEDTLRDDLNADTTERGALTEAFLVAVGDLVGLSLREVAGDDGRAQLAALERAIDQMGAAVEAHEDRPRPPVGVPGWESAPCPVCNRPVFEDDEHVLSATRQPDGSLPLLALHPNCAGDVQ